MDLRLGRGPHHIGEGRDEEQAQTDGEKTGQATTFRQDYGPEGGE